MSRLDGGDACGHPNTFILRRPGNIRGVITANPANVQHMRRSNFDNFPKGPRFRSILHDFLGDGICNSDGHLWKVQREDCQLRVQHPAASQSRCVDCSAGDCYLAPSCVADEEQVADMQDVLERYALDNVCKVAFNDDPSCLAADATGDRLSGFADAFRDAAGLSQASSRCFLRRFNALEEDYPEEFLRDTVISFILAGRETTSSALTPGSSGVCHQGRM